MDNEIIDTSVLLRFFVGDDVAKQKLAHQWFKDAEAGKRKLIVKLIVIAETAFILESIYKQPREKIAEALETLLAQKWLMVEERVTVNKIWQWYRTGLHFVDSYLLAVTNNTAAKMLTFDARLEEKITL